MGIRIHKILCYALTDVKTDVEKYKIIDDRFNLFAVEKIIETGGYEVFKSFLKWAWENQDGECVDILKQVNPDASNLRHYSVVDISFRWELNIANGKTDKRMGQNIIQEEPKWCDNSYVWDSEFGLPNVFGFVPCEYPDFYRYDDIIDYYDCEPDYSANPKLKNLDHRCGIHPHNGIMLRIKGRPEKYDFKEKIDVGEFQAYTGQWSSKDKPLKGEEVKQYFLENYRPIIPSSVLLWTYYIGIFSNWQETVQQLRPVIYTYWA